MADHTNALARIRQMTDAWEQRLPETIRTATSVEAIRSALPPVDRSAPREPVALVPHGEPIDIGWAGGRLDARLTLSVHPDMDQLEREQLLADLRDALAPVVPVRRTGREASS